MRVIAQRIISGEFLSWSVPLSRATGSRDLSGSGGVFGTIEPEMLRVTADDGNPLLEEWSTALYLDDGERIRSAGIVKKISTEGPQLTVEAPGLSAYPHGVPYDGTYRPDLHPEAMDVFRHVWSHVQSFPDANLGVTVDTAPNTWSVLSSGAGPFKIDWWEYRDCGSLLDTIAETVPFDYRETHTWNADHTGINHHIDLGFPRLGERRTDLVFEGDVNVAGFSAIGADGSKFANDVYMFGVGEDRVMRKARATRRDGRLRRPVVITRNGATQGQLDLWAQSELAERALSLDITQVKVRDHVNAPLEDLTPGDDILVEVEVPWRGEVSLWLRILGVNEAADAPGYAVLRTKRSDSFSYPSPTSPTGENQPVAV